MDDMTLVIGVGRVNRCRYVEVRKATFQRFQYGDKKLLISNEHKILLEEGKEEPLPTDCLGRGAMRKTNFPRLFIYAGEPGRETVSRMQSTEVDLELETRSPISTWNTGPLACLWRGERSGRESSASWAPAG